MTKLFKNQNARGLSRRGLLRLAVAGVSASTGLSTMRLWGSEIDAVYSGRLLVNLQLDGGADVTQLCDPKVNMPGERKINHWADSDEPGQIGNISYAPIAGNAQLFERFGADTLIINGVDAQTNSHETGRLFNWTGSNAEGHPSLSALFAAAQSPDQPLAYSVFGGISRTAGLINLNRFDDLSNMSVLARPDVDPHTSRPLRAASDVDRSRAIVQSDINRLLAQPNLSVRQRLNMLRYKDSRDGRDGLERLAELIPAPDEIEPAVDIDAGGYMFWSNLKQQMQGALMVFQSGLGSAADLSLGGFDSHDEHDPISDALFAHLADALNFFWDQAEKAGLADRILLVVGSDFGRTNHYNDANGKDHWPVGSYMIMERGATWGDRVVGLSDELHFAQPINPATLKADRSGVIPTPAHVHQSIRAYLGLTDFAEEQGMGLNGVESLPLFDPFLSSSI